jgi:hypothetical protein
MARACVVLLGARTSALRAGAHSLAAESLPSGTVQKTGQLRGKINIIAVAIDLRSRNRGRRLTHSLHSAWGRALLLLASCARSSCSSSSRARSCYCPRRWLKCLRMQHVTEGRDVRAARAARFATKKLEVPVPQTRRAFADAGPNGRWVVTNRDDALYNLLVRWISLGLASCSAMWAAANVMHVVAHSPGSSRMASS